MRLPWNKMKPSAYLINTARGELIDDAASAKRGAVQTASPVRRLMCSAWSRRRPVLPCCRKSASLSHRTALGILKTSKLDVRRKAIEDVVRVLTGQEPLSPVNQADIWSIVSECEETPHWTAMHLN